VRQSNILQHREEETLKVKYTRIYTGEDGESHIEDVETEMTPVDFAPPAPAMDRSALIPSTAMHFLGVPAGWYGEPHPAPRRQFMLILQGEAETSVSNGDRRRCVPGSVFLLEDTTGKGHDLRVLGNDYLLMAVVRVAD
jgi:hypothetical protein